MYSIKTILSVIVTYNCDNLLCHSVETLQKKCLKTLIIDNSSVQECRKIVEDSAFRNKALTIFNPENMGIAYALNQGVRYAIEHDYKWILTLDQDSLVTPGMIETMFNVYDSLGEEEKKKTAGLFAEPVEKAIASAYDYKSDPSNTNCTKVKTGITSGNLLRTDIFNKVGLFEEKLFIDYVDHDFYLRLASAGYQLLECRGAKLIHQKGNYTQKKIFGSTTEISNHPAFRKYYITRNRMYIWETYGVSHPDFVQHDKKTFCKQLFKLMLVEDDKWAKLKMVVRGAIDCRRNKFGKLTHN